MVLWEKRLFHKDILKLSDLYSIASVEPKFTLVGGQNIPVTDLVLEVMEFETGPFLAEETEPKMRKGVASNFLTRLPIGKLKCSHVFSKRKDFVHIKGNNSN